MANYLIIGASSGIGKQLAIQLAASGHRVYATYYSTDILETNSQISYHPLNVLDEILNLDFLPDALDGLIYCPGSINLKPFGRISPSEFVDDYILQVVGAIKVIQSVFTKLRKSGNGSIVLFSTIAVQNGFPYHTQVSASKGAIEGLTKALAAEFSPKIRVNCIAPSLTDTPLSANLLNTDEKKESNATKNPLKRNGLPADIANMAEFLLSDKASWITGQILHVDGGFSTIKK
ncbi:MAG: SDR family NAD(P)-dependent oxidoreductase [Candidatus Saccharimonadaceae bacterium]